MTKTEVIKMLEFAKTCYQGTPIKDATRMVEVWAEMFADVDAAEANQSMKNYCKTGKYFPSVADIMLPIKEQKDRMKGYIKC